MDEPAAKKPKPTPTAVIGPSNTGTGAEIGTQLFVCVEHLTSIYPNSIRREDMAMRDGFNVLYNEELFARLIKHHSVKWDPKLELLRYKVRCVLIPGLCGRNCDTTTPARLVIRDSAKPLSPSTTCNRRTMWWPSCDAGYLAEECRSPR